MSLSWWISRCCNKCSSERGNTKDMAQHSRNRRRKAGFTAEAQSSQSSECFLIKNSLLRALRASAVKLSETFVSFERFVVG
jgi:hypothetical protein